MPRRRGPVDYDQDDLCDDYDYFEEEPETVQAPGDGRQADHENSVIRPVGLGSSSQNLGTGSRPTDSTTELDDLVDEFRQCFGDRSIRREQIDAVLVAANYDVEEAMLLLERNLSDAGGEAVRALESAKPSAIALMIDSEEQERAERTTPLTEYLPSLFANQPANPFSTPSPDDVVRQKQNAGRFRAVSVSSSIEQSRKTKSNVNGGVKQLDPKLQASNPRQPRSEPATGSSVQGVKSLIGNRSGTVHVSDAASGKSKRGKVEASTVTKIEQRAKAIKLPPPSELAREAPSVAIVVAGHVDAGKSTLLGHLLRLVGAVSVDGGRRAGNRQQKSRATSRPRQEKDLAWTTDEDKIEQERGVTIDISTKQFRGRSSKVVFNMIDAPGHRDFVPAMILGASLANAAILVVDASLGEFESGFSNAGQTREHALLIRALGISRLIVVVNKMDVIDYSQMRYSEIRTAITIFLNSIGWKVSTEVVFVPTSGLCGINLVDIPGEDHPLRLWHKHGTLLDVLEEIPPADPDSIATAMSRPTRMVISDVFKSSSLGGDLAVCGRLICGTLAIKDKLLVSPSAEIAQVKTIQVGLNSRHQNDRPVVAGADNLSITVGLVGIPDNILISPGDILCDPASNVPVVSRFRARVLVLDTPSPLVQGTQVDLHLGGRYEAAKISRLNQLVDVKGGNSSHSCDIDSAKKCRPRRLVKGNSAVVEITVPRKICAELGVDVKFLGRFALRCQGRTIAVGVVIDLLM